MLYAVDYSDHYGICSGRLSSITDPVSALQTNVCTTYVVIDAVLRLKTHHFSVVI